MFWNSWPEFFNTTLKTQEDKFKGIPTQFPKYSLQRKKKNMREYGSTEGVKTPLKNGLGKEPTLETLTL